MKVQAEITIYEIDGEEIRGGDPKLVVNSHWNRDGPNGLVILEIDEHSYSVSKSDLAKAIDRCVDL